MTNHINAMELLARGILSSAVQFNGVIMFKFKGENHILAYQDEDGIHVQRRQNTWEVYTPTYRAVYKKSWECWYVQELVNTRNAIVCHRWEAEDDTLSVEKIKGILPKGWYTQDAHVDDNLGNRLRIFTGTDRYVGTYYYSAEVQDFGGWRPNNDYVSSITSLTTLKHLFASWLV